MISFDDLACTDEVQSQFERACSQFSSPLFLGRVVSLDRNFPLINTREELVRAELSTTIKKSADSIVAVGDWVAIEQPSKHEKAIIRTLLPRRNEIARIKRVGREGQEQRHLLASNVDIVFVCAHFCAKKPELKRIVRQIAAVYGCDSMPVVLFMKTDISSSYSISIVRNEIDAIYPDVRMLNVSVKDKTSIEDVRKMCSPATTALLLGESGVGKSTLVNALIDADEMETGCVRERDNKGRHTTVARRMLHIPNGGLLIDAPGLRTMQILDVQRTLALAFPDVFEAARKCKYSNCTHRHEPNCAVRESISAKRLNAYFSLLEIGVHRPRA